MVIEEHVLWEYGGEALKELLDFPVFNNISCNRGRYQADGDGLMLDALDHGFWVYPFFVGRGGVLELA